VAAVLSRADAERALVRKLGMTREDRDHRWYVLEVDGQVLTRTFVSTGSEKDRTLGHDLVASMARQLGVSTPFFVGIVDCSRSRGDYLAEVARTPGE
jgi:hypothetical protein